MHLYKNYNFSIHYKYKQKERLYGNYEYETKMMATLWDNTYRVAIDDGQGKYIWYWHGS